MTTDEQIARVLELHTAAAPGPWMAFVATRGNPVDGPTRIDIRDIHVDMVACIEDFSAGADRDASLISEYRTLAPLLARKLERALRCIQKFDREGYLLAEQTLEEIEEME